MQKRKLLLIIVCTLAMLIATSSVVFGVTHPTKYQYYTKTKGVDVSYWNGTSTDYAKVKAAGYKFVFIRLGYTTLGSFTMNADSTFATNYKNAKAAGLKVGVYYYAQATSTTEASKEADYVLSKVKGYSLDLPIVYDFEKPSGERLATAYSSWVKNYGTTYARKRCTDISLTFLNKIKASGRSAMFYSYRALMDPSFSSGACLNMSSIDSTYPVWIAQYSSSIAYGRNFNYWQYSSTTKVSGMSGYVDVNYWYYRQSFDISKCSVAAVPDQKYTGKALTPKLTIKSGTTTLIEGTDYYLTYSNNTNVGTATVTITGMNNPNVITRNITFKVVPGTPIITTGQSSYNVLPSKAESGYQFNLNAACNSGGKLTYSSDNEDVATVDDDGNVKVQTIKADNTVPTAKITITSAATSSYTAGSKTVTITVDSIVPVITTSSTSFTRIPSNAGTAIDLATKVEGNLAPKYKSSNEEIATVKDTGHVITTGVVGNSNITITTEPTQDYKATSKTVKVTTAKLNPTIAISKTAYSFNTLTTAKTFSISATRTGDGTLSYSSNNTAIAKVDNTGKVTITGTAGTATITVKTSETTDYNTASKNVTVTVNKVSPTISASSKTKNYGNSAFYLGAKSNYGRALTYSSSSKSVATINSAGKIYIKGTGKTTITITAKGNGVYNTVSKKVTITVTPKKQTITYLKKYKKSYFKVKMKYDSRATGYQIRYGTTKSFTGNVTSKYVSKKTTTKTIKVYYPKKKYYVKIRSYRTVNGVKVFGPYSSVKTVWTK